MEDSSEDDEDNIFNGGGAMYNSIDFPDSLFDIDQIMGKKKQQNTIDLSVVDETILPETTV